MKIYFKSALHISVLIFQELKKKKGIKDEVQLTSKQKEMMQMQLEKESAVRKRLQGVWVQFCKCQNTIS